ncbi:MAG: response regulator [Acidobacteriota bacterium]
MSDILDHAVLERAIGDVWTTWLGCGLSPCQSPVDEDEQAARPTITVGFRGSWNGALTLSCDRELLLRAARLMLAIDPSELTDRQLADTLGELGTIIGGAVKTGLGTSTTLTPPVAGPLSERDQSTALASERLAFTCDGHRLEVCSWQLPVTETCESRSSKVLVVDDSTSMRMIVLRHLGWAGHGAHGILQASDGLEALQLIRAERPALVLSDWNMPRMSGLELLQQVRREGMDMPFGLITSECSDSARAMADEAGAQFLLRKPFTAEQFAEALEETMAPA